MVDYFVRIELENVDRFYDFCERHFIKQSYKFEGIAGRPTELYKATMTNKDAIALKLSIPVTIMKA
jgi:hypothetical protein